jgi:hypothetical protein
MSTETYYEWVVLDDPGDTVQASGTVAKLDDAYREARHYAMQYAQDFDVRYKISEIQSRLVGEAAFTKPNV